MTHVFLIGTSHDYQRLGHPQAASFREVIDGACKGNGVKALAEEMSREGLRGAATSVGEDVAAALRIAHCYCDPNSAERAALAIVEADDIRMSGFFAGRDEATTEAEVAASYEKREREWLRRLRAVDTWPVLFVCGADHVHTFRQLLEQDGLAVQVLFEKWVPTTE